MEIALPVFILEDEVGLYVFVFEACFQGFQCGLFLVAEGVEAGEVVGIAVVFRFLCQVYFFDLKTDHQMSKRAEVYGGVAGL